MSTLLPTLAVLWSITAPSHKGAAISSIMAGQTAERSPVKVRHKSLDTKRRIYHIGRVVIDGAASDLVQETWNEVSEALPPERLPNFSPR